MFQSIQPDEIFDLRKAQASEDHPSYWLAQLRKADWQYLLKFVDMKLPMKTKKQAMAEAALQRFEFTTCDGRGEVWQLWTELRKEHRTPGDPVPPFRVGLVSRHCRSSLTWKRMIRSAS